MLNRPYVIINSASTLDGKISKDKKGLKISDKNNLIYVHKLRDKVDAIMVGINTVEIDDPMLDVRYIEKTKDPKRIVVDSLAKISIDSQIIKTADKIETYLATTEGADLEKIEKLKSLGVKIIVCGGRRWVDLSILMEKLNQMTIKKVLVEGGARLNYSIISNDLFDEIRITIGPYIVGGKEYKTFTDGLGYKSVEDSKKVRLKNIKKIDDFVILKYTPIK